MALTKRHVAGRSKKVLCLEFKYFWPRKCICQNSVWFLVGASHMRNLLKIWKATDLGRSLYICKVGAGPQVQLIPVTNVFTAASYGGAAARPSASPTPTRSLAAAAENTGMWARAALMGWGLASSGHSHKQGLKWRGTDTGNQSCAPRGLSLLLLLCSQLLFSAPCPADPR